MDSLKLVHPFTLILAGPSGSGKNQFVKKLIENKMIKSFPKILVWCYGVYQTLHEEIPNISFHEGIPSNLHQYSDALIVTDDLMGEFLKHQESFSWNSVGEIIYKNTVTPGSNIAFFVNDFLRNRKVAPEGRYVFLRALNDANLPKRLDVNKKLYQNNKIIKKPIMYAR
ncbi:uncharacterized protein TNCV_590251 [Trichonephila clavipes]|nr:uncharacterized protein TNCV_590251 [Trichonephila clavipes]